MIIDSCKAELRSFVIYGWIRVLSSLHQIITFVARRWGNIDEWSCDYWNRGDQNKYRYGTSYIRFVD